MKLEIGQRNEDEDVLELYLECGDSGVIQLESKKNGGVKLIEFYINADGSWTKAIGGNLDDKGVKSWK